MEKYIEKIILPPTEYRAKPFWALNGRLEEKELKRQIAVLEEMGFGGAFLHSRTGLETEYMSEEWVRLIGVCADELAKRGMEAWLYDEDRWPSGTCGGEVSRKKRNRLKSILCEETDPSLYRKPPHLIGLFAADIEGAAVKSYRKISAPSEVGKGEKFLVFRWAYMEPQKFFNGSTYIDTLNRAATEDFLASTHEKYERGIGAHFGKEVKGIFQDEVSRGPMFNGFLVDDEKRMLRVPYTYRLFAVFRKIKKYDLREKLPLLYYKNGEENFSSVAYDFTDVVMRMLLENFIIPYRQWCAERRLKVTGHVLHEDSLSCQATMIGSVMQYYQYMDGPGIDNLGTRNYRYEVPKLASSVSVQLGKDFTLSELYGCSGWQMKLDDYKHDGDWQAFMGVDFRCPHLSWYTMKGVAKRDCPATIMSQSAWYKEYKAVEDYFASLNAALNVGEGVTENLIINPIESAWGLSRLGAYENFFGVTDAEYRELERIYVGVFEGLQKRGVDADFGDEAIIATHGRTENGLFYVGRKGYKRVLVPYPITLRETTLALLGKFEEGGGQVVFVGRYPTRLNGKRADKSFFAGFRLMPFDVDAIAEAVREDEFPVRLTPGDRGIFVRKRRTENGYLIVFLNSSGTEGAKVRISVPTKKNLLKIDLRKRRTEYLPFERTDEGVVFGYDFREGEELFVYESDERLSPPEEYEWEEVAVREKSFRYELSEDNFVVLDRASLLNDGEWDERGSVLAKDGLLREKYGMGARSGEGYQPWYAEKNFGQAYREKRGRHALRFSCEVEEEIWGDIFLMTENCDRFDIFVNGGRLDTSRRIPSGIDVCFEKIPLPGEMLVRGSNRIEFHFDFSEDLGLEAVYLCGKFAVQCGETDRIRNLPERLPAGDIGANGFPYYSGAITYYIPLKGGTYRVEADELYASALRVGDELLAFRPYRSECRAVEGDLALQYIFNRKNLFGCRPDPDRGDPPDLQKQGMVNLPAIYVRKQKLRS